MKRWPKRKVYFWETAPFFRLLLPLIAGILVYEFKWLNFSAIAWLSAAGISFLVAVLSLLLLRGKLIKSLQTISIHVIVITCGWLLSYYNDVTTNSQWFGHGVSNTDAYMARITTMPVEKSRTWKLETEILYALKDSTAQPAKGKALTYIYQSNYRLRYAKGDTILLPAKWERIRNAGNPFEFDYAKFIGRQGIHYRQFLSSGEIRLIEKGNIEDFSWTERSHDKCMDLLGRYVSDTAALGLLQAMLVGDRTYLDPDIRQAYADTGIVHIIAISGAHVSVFFFIVALLFWWIKNKKYHWLKYLLALPLVWFYVLMAGAPPSAIRAATMFSFLAIGLAFNKENNALNTLFATAFILLCAEPAWLFAVGFQLSFIAVLSLMLFFQPIYRLLPVINPLLKIIWGAVAASIAAEILIAPVVIFYFHMFPLWFFITNALAYFFMGIVLVSGMAVITFAFVPVVSEAIGVFISKLVQGFNEVVYFLQKLNPEPLHYLNISFIELVILYLSVTGIAVFIRQKNKAGIYVGIGSLCVFIIMLTIGDWRARNQEKLIVYNISGLVHAEHIAGKRHTVISTDTSKLNEADSIFSLKPAHIGWHAWQPMQDEAYELIHIGNKKVLFLNEPPTIDSVVFPVHYLVVNYRQRKFDALQLYKQYKFDKLIVAGNYGRTLQERWKQQCDSLRIPLHATLFDGAFVLE